jgi:hypothetical protein
MRRGTTLAAALLCALALAACARPTPPAGNTTGATSAPAPKPGATPGPLPNNAFKAQITLPDAPAKLRAGEKATVTVRVRNASDAQWFARGAIVNTNPGNRFYIAAGDRWLKADGQTLVTDMDGRYGIAHDLKPGEEEEVPLTVNAPKEPGDYVLEVDLVQEAVSWFSDKGSPTAKAKVTVVR